MLRVEAGVVFRKEGIACVAEDAFHEVQVAHEVAGREEPGFHRLLRGDSRDFRDDDGTKQQGDEDLGGIFRSPGERKRHDVRRGIKRHFQQAREHRLGHGFFVGGNRQPSLGHVEHALGRPAVARGVVADSLMDAEGAQDRGFEFIRVRRQREHPGDAVALDDQWGGGQKVHAVRENRGDDFLTQIIAEKRVDGGIRRAEVVGEQPAFFLEIRDERATEVEKRVVRLVADDWVTPRRQLEVHEFPQTVFLSGGCDGGTVVGKADFVFEVGHGGKRSC